MTFPSDDELIAYIRGESEARNEPLTRRDIARAFGIKGPARTELRQTLKRLEAEGAVDLDRKRIKRPGHLPPVTVLEIVRVDEEGDLLCRPVKEEYAGFIHLASKDAEKAKPALGVGDRFLGKMHDRRGELQAQVLKAFGKPEGRVLGVVSAHRQGGGQIEPVSRRTKTRLSIEPREMGDAKDGDLVWAEAKPQRGYGPQKGRILEVLGPVDEPAHLSLIAIAEQDIRIEFPAAVIREAEALDLTPAKAHEDLTALPLVTIDPATARDHDDAVHAEAIEDGFRLTVAIADVSYFVCPGTALDREAEKRGNSVYLPDRVVPMLPERLSNDLCSLKEGQVRLALCCEIEIGKSGGKRKHRFFRAKIKNHANLAYEKAQAIEDGELDGPPEVKTLFEAYRALKKARDRRHPLDLDMSERLILTDETGRVIGVDRKDRMDAHRLIEEFMVLANVCAAETLAGQRHTAIYRVHEPPDIERLSSLREYLEGLGYTLPKADEIAARDLNRVLERARERDEVDVIAMSVLRSQSQAAYDTNNVGHYGLSLTKYAHFTSPIRRYADLTVHRGLVRVLGLGPGAERDEDEARLQTVAEDISVREREAVQAERDTQARMLAAFLEDQVGATFSGRIGGVTRVGLFVTLDETGADGFVPIRTLGWERFEHDERRNALVSERSGAAFTLGMPVKVRLLEVTPLQGGLRFEILTKPDEVSAKSKARGKTPKPRPEAKAKGHSGKAKPAKTTSARAKGKKAASASEAPAPKAFKRRPKKPR
ncbi:MAG: ribonuclease R [Parvularcula sp.]|jgi:ribonuclease R|nr:ribonuclease R [Parvularcula sp.]